MCSRTTMGQAQTYKNANGNEGCTRHVLGTKYSLMEGLECVRCYLENLLVSSNGSFIDLKGQSEKISLRNAGT